MILGLLIGISITLNIILFIILKFMYSKVIKNNPLSSFTNLNNKKKSNDILDKIKKFDMEYWDI